MLALMLTFLLPKFNNQWNVKNLSVSAVRTKNLLNAHKNATSFFLLVKKNYLRRVRAVLQK